MDKKKALRIFLIAFAAIFAILAATAYAIELVSTSPVENAGASNSAGSAGEANVNAGEEVTDVAGGHAADSSANEQPAGIGSAASETPGNITPKDYGGSTHPYNTWNNPSSQGVDGYNYTDPQHYDATAAP